MITYPNLLENPANPNYHLEEAEVYLLKEASELISIKHYSYSLFAIWNSVIINIQRRIETFGIDNFLNVIDTKENYNRNGNNLKDRWLNVNEYKTVSYARELNILSHACHDLITMIYWMKSTTNEVAQKNIDENELFSILYLLEKNLFLKEFKHDMRSRNTQEKENNPNRRKADLEINLSEQQSRVHDEILLKTGMKVFEEQKKDEEEINHILDKYI